MSAYRPFPMTLEDVDEPERSRREKSIKKYIDHGISPDAAIMFWIFSKEIEKSAFTGVAFALLSYLFYDSYRTMFGLYLSHHIEVLDCILYEVIILWPSDVPFIEYFLKMEVSLPYFMVGVCYILTAMTIEGSVLFIRLLLRLALVLISGVGYLVEAELRMIYAFGIKTLPWYLKIPLGVFLASQDFRFYIGFLRGVLRGARDVLPCWAIGILRLAVIHVPQIWRASSKGLHRVRGLISELVFRIHETLAFLLSFRRYRDQPYIYEPLHTGYEIRLLSLNGQFWGPELQGMLIRTHIAKLPPYECISHRWSDPSGRKVIVLNGRNINVSTNVYDILRQRRAFFSSRLIWIDSVCINQDDPNEKSHQVRKMQIIYAKAARVTICLGDSPDAHLARRLVHLLFSHIILIDPKEWTKIIVALHIQSKQENGRVTPPEWQALMKLLRHSWWERCWVVQEVVLAHKVYLLYGGKYIDWSTLLILISALTCDEGSLTCTLIMSEDTTYHDSTPIGLQHGPVMEAYRREYREKKVLEFHDLLRNCIMFRATDPRDKIFALQGITEAATAIPIDYQLSIEDVLMNTARYFIKRPGAIEVLQNAGIGWIVESDGTEAPKMPSWVADWSRPRRVGCELSYSSYKEGFLYRAAVEKKAQVRELDDRTIELAVVHVDYIKTRGKTKSYPPENVILDEQEASDKWVHWLREATSIARSLPSKYHISQSQSEAFWRTCIADRNGVTRPASPSYGEKYLDFRQFNLRRYALNHPRSTPGPYPISENENLLPEEGQLLEARYKERKPDMAHIQNALLFSDAMVACCNGRCFAVTEKGYIGIVPPGTKEGDMLCLVMGAQVPFVLRPLPDPDGDCIDGERFYALVGECYVHGMMDGEGLRQGLVEQPFTIR